MNAFSAFPLLCLYLFPRCSLFFFRIWGCRHVP